MNYELFQLGVKALIKNDDNKVLLLFHSPKNIGIKPYWDLPGGRIEKNETVENTLKKELREEIGIEKFNNHGLVSASIANFKVQGSELILFIYDCSLPGDSEIKLGNEHIKFDWVDKKKALELLGIKYNKKFLEKIF
ncbi:NUDIX hydrolase [Patescibacteria group bacterium]